MGSREDSKVVGRFGEDVLNDSGERLIDLCELNRLQILNGFFQHKLIHQYTRERPSLHQKSIIDYVIKRQISKIKIKDCRVKRGANCGSDHRLVIAELVVPFHRRSKNTQRTQPPGLEIEVEDCIRYKLRNLHDNSIEWLYKRRLDLALAEVNISNNIEEEYENIKSLVKKIATEVLGEE